MLSNGCLFTHPAVTEQHYELFWSGQYSVCVLSLTQREAYKMPEMLLYIHQVVANIFPLLLSVVQVA